MVRFEIGSVGDAGVLIVALQIWREKVSRSSRNDWDRKSLAAAAVPWLLVRMFTRAVCVIREIRPVNVRQFTNTSMRIGILLLLSLFKAVVSNNTTGWQGCYEVGQEGAKVKIGDPTLICLQVGNTANWTDGVDYIRLSFQPQADQYSRLFIPSCKLLLISSYSLFSFKTRDFFAHTQHYDIFSL